MKTSTSSFESYQPIKIEEEPLLFSIKDIDVFCFSAAGVVLGLAFMCSPAYKIFFNWVDSVMVFG